MKIIIIGGIAGLSASWELSGRADVTLLEDSATLGGKLVSATLETPFGILITAIGAPFWDYPARKIGRER